MSAVYIHIPFCMGKCAYCDFASWPGRESEWEGYVRAVRAEILESNGGRAETVFFGGGTPSILPEDALLSLLSAVRQAFSVSPSAEITVEMNPGTASAEKFKAYAGAGVNRVSIGAQAAQPRLLSMLGRLHAWAQVEEAVRLAHGAGIENINVDLIYGLPGQSVADARESAARVRALGVKHASLYNLILEDGTPLKRRVDAGELALPGEEEQLCMRAAMAEALAGMERYEISNYAVPGYECRHNLTYWLGGDYYGFGCAAHSLVKGERYQNPDSLEEYLAGARGVRREALTPEGAREEAIMLGTRTRWGVSLSLLNAAAVQRLEAAGLARREADRLVLTDAGLDVQNAVVLALL